MSERTDAPVTKPLVVFMGVLDLPLTAAMDTLLLPFDLAGKSSPAKDSEASPGKLPAPRK